MPVLGGVVEFGTSDGPCTATWGRFEDAGSDGLPKAELNKAFRGGATYAIFWKPDYRNGKHARGSHPDPNPNPNPSPSPSPNPNPKLSPSPNPNPSWP